MQLITIIHRTIKTLNDTFDITECYSIIQGINIKYKDKIIVKNKFEGQKENLEENMTNLKDADSIVFSADISNEEALVFQALKEKDNIKLICVEAKAYQDFMKAYSSISGYHLFKGDLNTLAVSEVVISFGVWFRQESDESSLMIRQALEKNRPKFVYMHPIEDTILESTVSQFIKYEVGSEEGVAALLADTLLKDKDVDEEISAMLEDLDIGYLSAESNVGEEELEAIYDIIGEKTTLSLIIGSDVYTHPKAEQIAKLIALLEVYADVNILCIPPAKNAMGIALICELDDMPQGQSVLYKSCKEGTYVNVDKCVYLNEDTDISLVEGLNSIANTLGFHAENFIGYSNKLPQNKGFQIVGEDDLKKSCLYKLMPQEQKRDFILDEIDELPVYDGAVIYTYKVEKPIEEERIKEDVLRGSKQFAMATKLEDGDVILFEILGIKFKRVFKIDTHMKGVIALNPTFAIDLSASLLSSYKFSRLAFEKLNNQKIGNNNE